jgi:hypothetical protein
MRRLVVAAVAAVVGLASGAISARADSVEVTGVHLCCNRCVTVAVGAVGKAEGVSDAKGDRATKKLTFTAKDDKAVKAAQAALTEAGFNGSWKVDGKDVAGEAAPKDGKKVAEVTVSGAHICCNACKNAAKGLFKDATVDFPTGKKDTIKITGKDLDTADVLSILHKAGFGGKID